MIFDTPLTEQQRKRSQLNYNRFCLINGASYMCLGETVIVLFANKLEAPNAVLACLGAMLYLGFILLPLGIHHAGKVGAARSQADFWICRNISALIVASSSFVMLFNHTLAWCVLMLGAFLFYGCRGAGLVMAQPLIGDITCDEDRAKFLGESCARFYIAAVFSLTIVSLILAWNNDLWIISSIIVAGAIMGVMASTFIRKIDETATLSESARKPFLPQMFTTFKDVVLRRQIYAGIVLNFAYIMISSMSVAALKRSYGISDTRAIIFATVQFAASIVSSKLNGSVARLLGPRKQAIYCYLLTFPVCIFWLVLPPTFSHPAMEILFCIPFFLLGLYQVFYTNALIHYFLQSVPKERQVAGIMFINILAGVLSSLIAMPTAAAILECAESFYGTGNTMFKAYFAFSGILLAVAFPILFKLKHLRK